MNKFALLIAAALTGTFFVNCVKSPTEHVSGSREDPALAQSRSDSAASALLLPVYQLNREAATHKRLTSVKGVSLQPSFESKTELPVLGSLPGNKVSAFNPKPRPNIAGALQKNSSAGSAYALSKSAAVSAVKDTAYLVLGDSAKGYIHWVHAYAVVEAGAPTTANDTLVYKWPYDPRNATVLGHYGSRVYADGLVLHFSVTDEDGDKILNQAVAPKSVQLQKTWTTVRGDTTWKSVFHTTHGSTTFYDSLGEGAPTNWTDTVFVKGKNVHSQWIKDGDNDGFVNTAAAGKKPKIFRDTYIDLGDGTFRFDSEILGAGVDGQYSTEADNELYPSRSRTVNSLGQDVSGTKYGDGDGDGFVWNPAGVSNLATLSNEYAPTDTVPVHTDSMVQNLSGIGVFGGLEKKITHFSATKQFASGLLMHSFTRIPSNGTFSGSDTVQVWEKKNFLKYARKSLSDPDGDYDSTLRVTCIIPGNLHTSNDDKVTLWYSQVWFKAGGLAVYESESFTPTTALAAGEIPKSGVYRQERKTNPTSSKSVIRSVLFKDFDGTATKTNWTRTDYFENEDSASASGNGSPSGAGSYSQELGQGARNSGFYDSQSGVFADTVVLLNFKGEEKGREIAWGTVNAATGAAEYYSKRLVGQDTMTARITVVATGHSGLLLTRTSANVSTQITLKSDTATFIRVGDAVTQTLTWAASGAGTFLVSQVDKETKTGAVVGTGAYFFGQDFSGNGTWGKTPVGKPAVESKVQFQSDGAAYVDGIKVSP